MKKDYLLIDTNVWVYYFNNNQEVRKIVFDILDGDEYELCTNDILKYELEIGLKSDKDMNLWKETIETQLTSLPIDNEVIKSFNVYKNELLKINKNKNLNNNRVTPKSADTFIGAQLIRYKGAKLTLLTANHKDFPVQIFNRDKNILWAETLGSPISFCFYKYNNN